MFQNKHPKRNQARRQSATRLDTSFRRNTVVTSRSERELAAHQQSVTQRQLDHKRSQRRRQFRHRLILAGLLALVFLFYWQQRVSSLQVVVKRPYRLESQDLTKYQNSAESLYKQHTIASQAWLLDKTALARAIQKQHPEVAGVDISSGQPWQAAVRVNLVFRRPVFIWRDVSKKDQFIDSRGVLFDKNYDRTIDTKKLVRIEDESGVVLEAGNSVLTANLISFVGQLHSQLPAVFDGKSVSRVIVPRSTREVQIQISGKPYLIKFNSSRDLAVQVGELTTLLAFLKRESVVPASYIDLRVADKVFYK